jgi:hypothetical protein
MPVSPTNQRQRIKGLMSKVLPFTRDQLMRYNVEGARTGRWSSQAAKRTALGAAYGSPSGFFKRTFAAESNITLEPKSAFGFSIIHRDVCKIMVPNNTKEKMKERNQAIKELDQVRAQIARNSGKAKRVCDVSYTVLQRAEAKDRKIQDAAINARDKVNAPLRRRVAFLLEEVKALI